MAAERLIERSKIGRPECEDEKQCPCVFVAFVPGIYQPQAVDNALFRACVSGISLGAIIETGDYRNEEDPLRAMVTRGNMSSNVLTRQGWLRPGRDNMGAFVEYIRDTCALDFLVGVCHMPAAQFRDLQLSPQEYNDLGITLEDVRDYFRDEMLVWSERKRMGANVNRLQIVASQPRQDSFAASEKEEENPDAVVDAYFQSLVHDASKVKE